MPPGRVYRTAAAYFESVDWEYAPVGDDISVALAFQGSDEHWRCIGQSLEEQNLFVFYSACTSNAAESALGETARFVARANYGMLQGAFELDLDDGDLRYRTTAKLGRVPADGWENGLATQLIADTIQVNVVTMDQYIHGLLSVASGSSTADDAIRIIEG
jgi:hypothetical protein